MLTENVVFICEAFTQLLRGENYVSSKGSCSNTEPQQSGNITNFTKAEATYIENFLKNCDDILLYSHNDDSTQSKVSITKNKESWGGTTQNIHLLKRIDGILNTIAQMRPQNIDLMSLAEIIKNHFNDVTDCTLDLRMAQVKKHVRDDISISQDYLLETIFVINYGRKKLHSMKEFSLVALSHSVINLEYILWFTMKLKNYSLNHRIRLVDV